MKNKIIKTLSKVERKGFPKFMKWLKNSDFFVAPCSKNHHMNVEGGLAEHSWNVYQLFKEKNKKYKLGLSEDSVIICGLFHDICKVNYLKKVGEEYDYDDKFPIGHGEKSVIVLQRFFDLTDEEACMIRWHMGGFDVSSYSKYTFNRATQMYPASVALHTADYEAAKFLED